MAEKRRQALSLQEYEELAEADREYRFSIYSHSLKSIKL